MVNQGGRGQWAVFFLHILVGWFIKLSVQIFQQLILIYRRGNFVYLRLGIYQFIGNGLFPLAPWVHHGTYLSKISLDFDYWFQAKFWVLFEEVLLKIIS